MIRALAVLLFFVLFSLYDLIAARRFSVFAPVLSGVFGALFCILYPGFSPVVFASLGLLCLCAGIASRSDILTQTIHPAELVLTASAAVLTRTMVPMPLLSSPVSVALVLAALGIPWLLTRGRWLGSGDVLFTAALAVVLEPVGVPFVLLGAALSGFVAAAIRRITGRRAAPLPFIPLISLSFFFYYPFQDRVIGFILSF